MFFLEFILFLTHTYLDMHMSPNNEFLKERKASSFFFFLIVQFVPYW